MTTTLSPVSPVSPASTDDQKPSVRAGFVGLEALIRQLDQARTTGVRSLIDSVGGQVDEAFTALPPSQNDVEERIALRAIILR